MLSFSQSIIINVGEDYINTFLRQQGLKQPEEKQGRDLKYWIDDLLCNENIKIEDFENFLFDELFFGKRKTIRVYKLDGCRNYKYPRDWESVLREKYGLDNINFINIIETIPNKDDTDKIVACQSEENNKGELTRLRLIFGYAIQMDLNTGLMDSIAYVPVEIDFEKEQMTLKAWTRNKVSRDEYKADNLLEHTKRMLEINFNVCVKEYYNKHKKALFEMSKEMITEAYAHLPNYNIVDQLESPLDYFIKSTFATLKLENVTKDDQGNSTLIKDVMDYKGELRNVIEGLVVSDYFYKRKFEEIWKLGLDAIVARIKFNDKENVLTSLRGENTAVPIFCTKTFMSIKNRMEETEQIEAIWIAMNNRKNGRLNLKYDASNDEYLELLIRYGIRFNEDDMNLAMENYEKYESNVN